MASGACVFCEIVAARAAAHVVLETDAAVAFLDVRPVFPGHVLVAPRVHHGQLVDVPPGELGSLFGAVRRVAAAVPVAMESHGTFVAINNVVSQSVPHLHVHVVPRRFKDGLRGFFWPRTSYAGGEEEMADVAARIAAAVTNP